MLPSNLTTGTLALDVRLDHEPVVHPPELAGAAV
jgi:hypothetical protein